MHIENPASSSGRVFGQSVSTNCNGDRFVVGAPFNHLNTKEDGAVYVYDSKRGNPKLIATIKPPHNKKGKTEKDTKEPLFGYDVDIDCDGNRIVVGSPSIYDEIGGGFVYLFDANTGKIMKSFPNPQYVINKKNDTMDKIEKDYFGYSVIINKNRILAGAPKLIDEIDAKATATLSSGLAYLFNTRGSLMQTIYPPKKSISTHAGLEVMHSFGTSLAINRRNEMLVSAPKEDYVWLYSPSGRPEDILNEFHALPESASTMAVNNFGQSIAMNADGNQIYIAASPIPVSVIESPHGGYVYLYNQRGKLIQTISTEEEGDAPPYPASHLYGTSLAINSAGMSLMLGTENIFPQETSSIDYGNIIAEVYQWDSSDNNKAIKSVALTDTIIGESDISNYVNEDATSATSMLQEQNHVAMNSKGTIAMVSSCYMDNTEGDNFNDYVGGTITLYCNSGDDETAGPLFKSSWSPCTKLGKARAKSHQFPSFAPGNHNNADSSSMSGIVLFSIVSCVGLAAMYLLYHVRVKRSNFSFPTRRNMYSRVIQDPDGTCHPHNDLDVRIHTNADEEINEVYHLPTRNGPSLFNILEHDYFNHSSTTQETSLIEQLSSRQGETQHTQQQDLLYTPPPIPQQQQQRKRNTVPALASALLWQQQITKEVETRKEEQGKNREEEFMALELQEVNKKSVAEDIFDATAANII